MRKTIPRTPSFLLVPALLLPLLLSACSPISPEQTTPGSTTVETQATTPDTTSVTEPPQSSVRTDYATAEERAMYEKYWNERMDKELKAEIYALIDNTMWPPSNTLNTRLEEFYEEYLEFKKLGKKIVPYLLMYIEETDTAETGFVVKMRLAIIANKMLGYDNIKG